MDPNMLEQQQRLARVSKHQWWEALNGLTRHLTKKLNAKLLTGEAEWRDDQTLEEALTEAADQLMKQQVQDWKRRRHQQGIQTEADGDQLRRASVSMKHGGGPSLRPSWRNGICWNMLDIRIMRT